MASVSVDLELSNFEDQTLFELLPVPAYIFDDADLRFVAVNAAALRRYDYTRDAFLSLHLPDLRAADEPSAPGALPDPIDNGPGRTVLRHRTRSGDVFHVDVVSQPMVFSGRRCHFVLVNELTERQRIQEALQESHARSQALFDNALDAILFVDNEARFVSGNEAAVRLLGWTLEELQRQYSLESGTPGS